METPLNTHENVAMEALPTGRHRSCRTKRYFVLYGILILTGVFLLGYAASYWNASGMVKRLLLRSRQPKETLKIALCQYDTRINNLPWNLSHAIALAEEAFEQGAHYVILPEFSFSGMTELRSLHKLIAEFEQIGGAETLRQVARRNRGYFQFNHPVLADGVFWNETVLLNPDGEVAARYHKRKLVVRAGSPASFFGSSCS